MLTAAGDPEVDQPGPVHAQEDVPGLHVAVYEALLVHHREGLGQGLAEDAYGAQRERAVGRDGLGEGGSGDEGGGEPRLGGVRVGTGDADGPGAVHLGGDLGLAAEAGPEVGLFGVLRADHLDRGERAVVGPAEVDDAHAAGAEASEEPVPADPGGVRGVERLHQPAAFPSSCLAWIIIWPVPLAT